MAYRRRPAIRRRGRIVKRRTMGGRKVPRNRIVGNNYRFKRYGVNCQIVNTSNGVVNMNTPASGWALSGASSDVNNTFQFGGAMQFQLDQVIQHADFNQMFDRYKITGCKVTILPLGTYSGSAASGATAFTNFPSIAIAVDNDDASLPTSWEQIAVKQYSKIRKLNKPITMYVKNPKLALQLYNGAATGYTQKTGFVDMQQDNVPHYGLKFWIRECPLPNFPGSIVGAESLFRVVTKFYLAMKDPQ